MAELNSGSALPSVDIVIVNFNAGTLLGRTVESIFRMDTDSFVLEQTVVVDNASIDSSISSIDQSTRPVNVIQNDSNVGFAKGCNQGASTGSAKYLLFLNPDIRVQSGTIEVAVRFMEDPSHSSTGILGVQLRGDDGRVTRSCARFPKPHHLILRSMGLDWILPFVVPRHFMTEWDHSTNRVVDQVPGAFYLVRRSVFDQLAGFDERFFVYYEDLDFALRAKGVGVECEYLADVFAYHTGQGTSRKVVEQRLVYSSVSKIRYSFKHFGAFWGCLVLAATLTCEPFARTIWAVGRGQRAELRSTLRASPQLWARGPRLLVEGLRAGATDWRCETAQLS